MSEQLDIRKRRLKFRACHRGIREMDILFTVFVREHLDGLSAEECDQLEILLEESDHDILPWISGGKQIPEAFETSIMEKLRTIALKPGDYGQ